MRFSATGLPGRVRARAVFSRFQVFGNEMPRLPGIRFEDIDLHAMRAFRGLAHRKRVEGNVAGRRDPLALQHGANHHGFGGRAGCMNLNDAFLRVLLSHMKLSASTIAPSRSKVHTYVRRTHWTMTDDGKSSSPTQEEIDEESRRIRRLRILVHLTLEEIAGGDLSAEEAAGMIAATRRVALEMFPGKERAFDLIYRPKFQRIMHAVYRLQ